MKKASMEGGNLGLYVSCEAFIGCVGTLCLMSYLQETFKKSLRHKFSGGHNSNIGGKDSDHTHSMITSRPDFMISFDQGTKLTYLANHLSAAREMAGDRKLIVVYEPLTNRRQIHIQDEYKESFKGADHIYWIPSYLAREDPNDRIIEPSELIRKLSDPSIAEALQRDDTLLNKIREHLNNGDMVVAMAGGGGNSLDDWLRQNFKPDHQS